MKIIGLTGGIASGKSAVAAALARRGAVVMDADRIGHELLDDPSVRAMLVKRWGPTVLGDDGNISRPAVATQVFGASAAAMAERDFLENLLHPRIRSRVEREIAALAGSGVQVVVIDAPLLIEAGWGPLCDATLFVDAPEPQRRERAAERGWTGEDFARREAAQLPIDEKRGRSTHVIANATTLNDLDAAVGRFWSQVVP